MGIGLAIVPSYFLKQLFLYLWRKKKINVSCGLSWELSDMFISWPFWAWNFSCCAVYVLVLTMPHYRCKTAVFWEKILFIEQARMYWVSHYVFLLSALNWSEIEIILQSLFKCLFLAGRRKVWPLQSDWQHAAWLVANTQPFWVLPVVNRTDPFQQKQHPVSYSFFQEPAFPSPATALLFQVQARKQHCMKVRATEGIAIRLNSCFLCAV